MVRPPSPAARTTVFRLVLLHGDPLPQAIRQKYLESDDFRHAAVSVDDRAGMLLFGVIVNESVGWAERVEQLTGVSVELGNRTAAGVLLIRDDVDEGVIWALSYGMGFQLLEQSVIDPGFGQRIAVRAADPEQLRSLTRTTVDHRSRTDRSSIPAGEQLRGFGIGDFGEIVSRVVGSATIEGLTAGQKPVTIRGADSLSVPIGRTPATLLSDLGVLRETLAREPLRELAVLEQLVAVKNADTCAELDERLREALASSDPVRLAVGWPHERIDEHGTPSSYRLFGLGRGRSGPFDDVPTLDTFLSAVVERNPDDLLDAAAKVKVQLFRDSAGREAISRAIPTQQWLAFETDMDGRRYCLHGGRWYLMDQDYATRLREHVEEIFARPSGLGLPDWTEDHEDEAAYNKAAAQELGGVCLDTKLIRTRMHRRGIEPCDVMTPDGWLIHIKRLRSSQDGSHLIAQALVSAEEFLYDNEARDKMRERVEAAGGDSTWVNDRPDRLILGIARARPVTAADLFTFTQVTLARLDTILSSAGVTVAVVPIRRPDR